MFLTVRRQQPLQKSGRTGRASTSELEQGQAEESPEAFWGRVKEQALNELRSEPALASLLFSTIVERPTLHHALAYVLANKLGDRTLRPTQLQELMVDVYNRESSIVDAARADLQAVSDRDPACESFLQPLLFFKGFQAVQAHRLAHSLFLEGRQHLAFAIHSRVCRELHVDIHPAAQLGQGIMVDHAEGVVIGETASVGDNVSMLHHVTLGGSGREGVQRHPQVGDDVLIGASATLLGDVTIGKGAKVGAGSVVLDDVPPWATAVGVPAKVHQSRKRIKHGSQMDHFIDFAI